MNTALSGSGWVDDIKSHQRDPFTSDWDIKSHPQGERFGAELCGGKLRVLTSLSREAGDSVLVNTEKLQRGFGRSWRTRQDMRKFAAAQQISEEQALQVGLEQKAREFVKKGADIYAKA